MEFHKKKKKIIGKGFDTNIVKKLYFCESSAFNLKSRIFEGWEGVTTA